jgi:hypothetical protein
MAVCAKRRGAELQYVEDVMFVLDGPNPSRTLEPVVRAYSDGSRVAHIRTRPALRNLRGGVSHVRRIHELVGETLADERAVSVLDAALHAAVRSLARATAALEATRPRLVAVASQHSTISRAFIHSARQLDIPSAYIAHAPVADSFHYIDLPTDYVGLRGSLEVEFYRSLGCHGELDVVGNPQLHVDYPPVLVPNRGVVFAARPESRDAIAKQVQLLDSTSNEVVVAPHPRMRSDTRYSDLWPRHWTLNPGRTADLLRVGHPCVVQHSSGVAWEALAHGIPVIQLFLDRQKPAYPLIREPYVKFAATRSELAAALEASLAVADEGRSVLTEWAAQWCSWTGKEAIRRCVDLIAFAKRGGPRGALLDAWYPRGQTAGVSVASRRGPHG